MDEFRKLTIFERIASPVGHYKDGKFDAVGYYFTTAFVMAIASLSFLALTVGLPLFAGAWIIGLLVGH